jgi:hypothetical protein
MTLSQFREAVQPSLAARQTATEAKQRRSVAVTLHVQADKVTDELIKRGAAAVRGTRDWMARCSVASVVSSRGYGRVI